MLRRFIGNLFVLCFTATFPVMALGADISVQINEFGIYKVERTRTIEDTTQVSGQYGLGRFALLQTADHIPMQLGISFGITYVVTAHADIRQVKLRVITRYPSPGPTNPETGKTQAYDENLLIVQTGQKRHRTFTFDYEWEMLPGVWQFEIWDGNNKIAEKAFTVTKP